MKNKRKLQASLILMACANLMVFSTVADAAKVINIPFADGSGKENTISIGTTTNYSPNGIAIGKGAYIEDMGSATKEGIAIGTNAKALDGNSTSRWFGDSKNLPGGVSGIAIGKSTYANESTVDIGMKNKGSEASGANRRAVVSIGADSYAAAHFSTITGAYSTIKTDASKTIGGFFTGSLSSQGFGSTISGSLNNMEVNGDNKYDGMANVVDGTANYIKNANGAIILGAGNKVSDSVKDLELNGTPSFGSITNPNELNGLLNERNSEGNKPELGSVGVFGGGNEVEHAYLANVQGVDNTLIGKDGDNSKQVSVNGYQNRATNVTDLMTMGSYNEITNASENIAMGNYNKLTGDNEDRSDIMHNILFGFQKKDADKIGKNIMGNQILGSEVTVAEGTKHSVLIGDKGELANSIVDGATPLEGAVALGYMSVANRPAVSADSVDVSSDQIAVNTAATANKVYALDITDDADKTAIKGTVLGNLAAVSVGNATATRQITNVAAGSEDTDAVNVSQLRGTANALKKAIEEGSAKPWKLTTNGGSGDGNDAVDVNPQDTVDFAPADGDTNIIVSKTDKNVKIALNKDLTVDSVTAGDTKISTEGLTITDGPSVKKDGIDAGSKKITNIAEGTEDGDAVNFKQLKELKNKVSKSASPWKLQVNDDTDTQYEVGKEADTVINLKAGSDNITLVQDGGKVTFDLAKDLNVDSVIAKTVMSGDTVINNDGVTANTFTSGDTVINKDGVTATTVKAGDTTINNDGMTINNGPTFTKNLVDVNNQKITNVAAGTEAGDAVNYTQLQGMKTEMTNQLNREVERIDGDIAHTGSLGAALGALKPLQYDMLEPTQVMAGVGLYKGQTSVALGLAHYGNESVLYHGGIAWAGGRSSVMANVGVSWKFGNSVGEKAVPERYKQGPISAVYALEDEVSHLKNENHALRGQVSDLTNAYKEQQQQIAEYAQSLRALQAQMNAMRK